MFINLSVLKRNRNYRWLYSGQFISFFGTMITYVALPYQVYSLTHSTLMVGLLSLFQLAPLLFTALIGGVLADRYHRQRLLVIAETILAFCCLSLIFNALSSHPSVVIVFGIAAIMSALSGLHRPSLDSITQQMVDKADFPTIGSLAGITSSVGMILGPAIAGIIIAHFGIVITFTVDLVSFMFSLFSLLMIREIPAPPLVENISTWFSLKQGFQYAVSRQELLGSYLVDFVAMIFGMPMALFPAIAHEMGDAKVLGMLYAAPAVGALLISFFSGWTSKIKRHGIAIAVAAALWGIAIILFGLTRNNLWVGLFFLALAGAFDAVSGIFRSILWNETIPNELFGRLSGINMISYLSGPKLGDAEAGIVAAFFGVTASIVSGGILCVIGVGACCYLLPKFVRYRSQLTHTA